MLLGLQHFEGRRARWSSGMGTKMSDKHINYSHKLAQTKKQVGQCIVGTLLVHGRAMGKHKFTKFTMAQTWGKPSPSPLQYSLCLAIGAAPKHHFVPGFPSWSLEIIEIKTIVALEAHNFMYIPLIEVRSKTKLQSSLRAFQQLVA